MRIEKLRIKNFRALQDVTIEGMPPFCVFVGSNGSGKSTLFKVFGFLNNCLRYNVRTALQAEGGFKEVVTRGHDGEPIEIELKFRLEIANTERLVTYLLRIGVDQGRPVVEREILRYKRGESGAPFHFLDFSRGEGYAISNEEDFSKADTDLTKELQKLDSPDILAIKGLGQFQRFKAASAFRQLIENWHVSDFHISSARGRKDAAGYDQHLSDRGDNLQLVARYIHENYPETFNTILQKMKQRVPGVKNVVPVPLDDGSLLLKFQDGAFVDPFADQWVSDGTIKMFAYLILLYDPKPHPLLCVEEPENQLYPSLLEELAEEFRAYANRGGQVFVTTHSPDFLNAANVREVFWLAKGEDGCTRVRRAVDDQQLVNYMEEGDKMGYLWKEGFFKGVDPL